MLPAKGVLTGVVLTNVVLSDVFGTNDVVPKIALLMRTRVSGKQVETSFKEGTHVRLKGDSSSNPTRCNFDGM